MSWQVIQAECVEAMAAMEPDSVDAIVTDPPYLLGFMGKEWDRAGGRPGMRDETRKVQQERYARQAPGAPRYAASARPAALAPGEAKAMEAFHHSWATEALRILKPGGHILAFGGTRTYHRLACGIEDAGFEVRDSLAFIWCYGTGFPKSHNLKGDREGWGTALKPAHEPVVMGRKPLAGTVAANVEQHGTGALNIDGCRVGDRWPANLALDEGAAALVGDAARFFYCPKASKSERNAGLDGFKEGQQDDSRKAGNPVGDNPRNRGVHKRANHHPTVKPIDLMRWLVRLVTPPGGTVLDPFTGSGTTGIAAGLEGFDFVGIEREAEYCEIAEARLRWWESQPNQPTLAIGDAA